MRARGMVWRLFAARRRGSEVIAVSEIEREEEREEARRRAHARVWELAKQQGVEPIRSIEDLKGDFWPEEESVDEFLEWVRAIRRQDHSEQRSEQ